MSFISDATLVALLLWRNVVKYLKCLWIFCKWDTQTVTTRLLQLLSVSKQTKLAWKWHEGSFRYKIDRFEQRLRPVHTVHFFFWLRLWFLLSQLMDCRELNGSVHTMRLQQHHQLLYSPLKAKTNGSCKSHRVNGPLVVYLRLRFV